MHYGNTPDIRPGGPETFQSYDICWANASNTPFRRFKGWVHEGGISTPLIVHWPASIPAPGVGQTPAHLVDIMPTCLEVAGAAYPGRYRGNDITPLEGHSLVPAFQDPGWERPGSLFFEHEGYRAIRQGPWKLVSGEEERWELYQIDEDRTESTDLADHEKQRVGRMAGEWNHWAVRVGVNFNLRDDLRELLARQRLGVEAGRARLRRA